MKDLAMEVARFDAVMIGKAEGPDTGGGKVEADGAPKTSHSNNEDAAAGEPCLSGGPDTGEKSLSTVA